MTFEQWLLECCAIVANKLSSDKKEEKMTMALLPGYRAQFDRGLTSKEAVEELFMSWHD